ncbi:hypothetical protein DMP23_20180 [Amycolatopsis sp. A1MSW2902]
MRWVVKQLATFGTEVLTHLADLRVSFEIRRRARSRWRGSRQRSVTVVVGPSGAGKSALLKLIDRFFDVDTGAVRIGGRDVRELGFPAGRRWRRGKRIAARRSTAESGPAGVGSAGIAAVSIVADIVSPALAVSHVPAVGRRIRSGPGAGRMSSCRRCAAKSARLPGTREPLVEASG